MLPFQTSNDRTTQELMNILFYFVQLVPSLTFRQQIDLYKMLAEWKQNLGQ